MKGKYTVEASYIGNKSQKIKFDVVEKTKLTDKKTSEQSKYKKCEKYKDSKTKYDACKKTIDKNSKKITKS